MLHGHRRRCVDVIILLLLLYVQTESEVVSKLASLSQTRVVYLRAFVLRIVHTVVYNNK